MDKYKRVMDCIQQAPEKVRKLHDNIDMILEQKINDDFVSIEKTNDIINERNVETYKVKKGLVRVASAAAVILLVVVASFHALRMIPGEFMSSSSTPGSTQEKTPMPTPQAILIEEIEGLWPTKDGIKELFEEGGLLHDSEYREEQCYNITTPEIKEKTGCMLVYVTDKVNSCIDLLLIHDNEITMLISNRWAWVLEVECSDFDEDGIYEILFSYYQHFSGPPGFTVYSCYDLKTKQISFIKNVPKDIHGYDKIFYMKKLSDQLIYMYSKDNVEGFLYWKKGELMFAYSDDKDANNIEDNDYYYDYDEIAPYISDENFANKVQEFGQLEDCHFITPSVVCKLAECMILRFSNNKTIVYYKGEITELPWTGEGIKSMQICDVNRDGVYELLYSTTGLFSEDSSKQTSYIVHFDPKTAMYTRIPHKQPTATLSSPKLVKLSDDLIEVRGQNDEVIGCVITKDSRVVYESMDHIKTIRYDKTFLWTF